jgi:Na+-translocating ferredoxin:NAD+ oxidoreductase subunit E
MIAAIQRRDVALLLAMCPLLAVSDTVVNSIGAGVFVLIAAPAAALVYLAVRRWLGEETQLAAAFLLFAAVVSCFDILMRAYFYDLHGALGVFAPLTAANCALVGACAAVDEPARKRFMDVIKTSVAIAGILLVLGVARELVGRGSLLHDASLMFGSWARPLETKVFSVDMGFLLGMLPPGAFISLGLLLALLNWRGRS